MTAKKSKNRDRVGPTKGNGEDRGFDWDVVGAIAGKLRAIPQTKDRPFEAFLIGASSPHAL